MADAGEMSKSAKKRAAKKARDDAHAAAEAAAAAPPPPAPAAPAAKGKAKAKGKAEPAPAPAAAAPKAAAAAPKAKAAGKAAAAPAPEPEKPAGKAKAKAKAAETAAEPKAASKKKAKAPKVEEAPPAQVELPPGTFLDDGSGGWEGVSKKKEKKPKAEKAEAPAAESPKPQQQSRQAAPAPARTSAPSSNKEASLKKVEEDIARILAMKGAPPEAKPQGESDEPQPTHTDTVKIPDGRIGAVIGPKGATISLIKEATGIARIDTSGDVCTIAGFSTESVAKAKEAIQEVIEKGYTALMYEDFAEGSVNVHPSCFPDIIGTKGAVIRTIKEKLGVEVTIPKVPEGSPPGKKFKVGLAGSSDKVETAKDVISSIAKYSHHEVTHPGQKHEEMEVEQRLYSYIIGRAGSELKHIQKNWEVKVIIPREHSETQAVLIVGAPDNVDRSKAYIEKLLANADAPKGRDKPESYGDDYDDEGPKEKWMDSYLIKR